MEIWHRITINADTDRYFKAAIDKMEIQYIVSPLPGHKIGLIHFDIYESAPQWSEILSLIKEFRAVNISDTFFSEDEILAAPFSRLIPIFEQGYPQPESSAMAWKQWVYEDVCDGCGIFGRQKAEFRVRKEPRPGKKAFITLIGSYALLAIPVVFQTLAELQLRGFDKWSVLIHKTNEIVQSVAQLHITNMTSSKMIPGSLVSKECPKNKTIKYLPHMRGYMDFDSTLLQNTEDIFLSSEFFGDGKAAYREIIVSQKFARLAIENNWQGIRLKPIRVVS